MYNACSPRGILIQLFDRMKIENPTYRSQVQAIRGDFSQPDMGMDEADVNRIKFKINVVIHLAATTTDNSDPPTLHAAVCTNVRATRDLIELSKRFQNLKVGASPKPPNRCLVSIFSDPRIAAVLYVRKYRKSLCGGRLSRIRTD